MRVQISMGGPEMKFQDQMEQVLIKREIEVNEDNGGKRKSQCKSLVYQRYRLPGI